MKKELEKKFVKGCKEIGGELIKKDMCKFPISGGSISFRLEEYTDKGPKIEARREMETRAVTGKEWDKVELFAVKDIKPEKERITFYGPGRIPMLSISHRDIKFSRAFGPHHEGTIVLTSKDSSAVL